MSITAPQQTADLGAIPAPPRVNTVLADLQEAIETYAATFLTVQIYAVDPPGGSFNVGESATFKVRVNNSGPMHVHGLTLLMEGVNSSRVGEHGWASGQSSMQTPEFSQVSAHMQEGTWVEAPDDHYHLFVHQVLPAGSVLLCVSVKDWYTDGLAHLTSSGSGHSEPAPDAKDTYRNQVLGD